MPVTVKADILSKVQGRLTSSGGWEMRSGALVSGLPHNDAITQMLAAQLALANWIPTWSSTPPLIIGTGHPKLPTAILEEMTPRAQSPSQIDWELLWRQHFGTPTNTSLIEVGASIIEEQTDVDIHGHALAVEYAGSLVVDASDKVPQGAIASVPRAQPTSNFTRQETGSPGGKAETFVGAANAHGWAIDPIAPARTWLCTAILGTSRDGGQTYSVKYAFQKKMGGGTWDKRLVWIDPKTGRPPADIQTVGNGPNGLPAILVAQVVPELDFNTLALP